MPNPTTPRHEAALAEATQRLEDSELRYRIIADHSPDWEYWLGPDQRYIYVSPACEAISGYPPEAFLRDAHLFCNLLHADDHVAWHAHLEHAEPDDHHTHGNLLLRLIARDGQVKWLEHQCGPVFHAGDFLGRRGVNRDVTRRVQAEAEARHASRLLITLSEVNQCITREQNETTLIERICRIAVETGGLKACQVALRDEDGGAFRCHAWAGPGEVRPDDWLPALEGDQVVLPMGARQRLSEPSALASAAPRAHGIGAVIHYPLLREGQILGLIGFFADSLENLRQDVLDLLREMAGDLSFALEGFRHRRQEFEARYKLADREAYLRTMMQTLPLGIGVIVGRVFSEVNQGVCRMLGYSAEALLGQSTRMVYADDAEYQRVGREKYADLVRTGRIAIETRWRRQDGEIIDVNLISSAFDAGDLNKGVVFAVEDISQRKRADAALSKARQQLELAIEAADLGIYDYDLRSSQITLNERYLGMLGYAPGELDFTQTLWLSMIHPDDLPVVSATLLEDPSLPLAGVELEYRMRHKSGAWVWLLDRAKGFSDAPDGGLTRVVGTHMDLTARKQTEERLDFLSHYDTLTHLPNRDLLRDRLEHALQRVRREGEQLAVLMIDLDRFKTINESLGHSAGDQLLKVLASRMQRQMRGGDTLARVGGDEFILLLENDASALSASQVARKWQALCAQPVKLGDSELAVTASIGISLFPEDGDSADDLLRHADAALYRAKGQGRNTYQFYEQQMTAGAFEHLLLENALRGAVSRDELRVHYQPQIDFISGELSGVEALVRWRHPELGLIAPSRFIPLAEEAGIIGAIGEWVLRAACRQMVAWDKAGLHVPCVAVNLSVRQIERATLVPMVAEVLAASGLAGSRLELEVTESMIMRDTDQTLAILRELRELGVKLAIDDFGTGYSSLSYLKRLPMHRLKIDQSFVRDIGHDSNGEAIVRAIIALGRGLGLEIVAEGVELRDQADFLRDAACDIGQGYLYSRPIEASEILRQWAVVSPPP
jgi:diguanylate cyclase (GGDEF)-like protein/PAS domain S-box-containing protein